MDSIKITGMSCQHCVGSVEKALVELGLQDVAVNLDEAKASFSNPEAIAAAKIVEAIAAIGFEAKE